jgi:lysophospholipid acyltransferase (LPLAT)-like uncharacterized protein
MQAARAAGRPVILLCWHGRLLPLLFVHRAEGVVLLVSRHRDGGYLVDVARRWGYGAVRGSSRRGGEVGLLGIVRALRRGATVALTPDGPRGPAERVKLGAIAAAQHGRALIVPLTARPSAAWWLRSWDRFCVPRPFATIDVRYGAPYEVPDGVASRQHAADVVERVLHELTHAA